MARPVGSVNKLRPSVIEDVLQERGFNLVDSAVDLFFRTDDDKVKVQIIKMLMEYLYAKRRPEDAQGNPDEKQAPFVLSPEAALELLRIAKGEVK